MDDLVTTTQIAEALGVERDTVWYWLTQSNKGKGPYGIHPFPDHERVIGSTKLWDLDKVKTWAEKTGRAAGKNRGGAGTHTRAYQT